MEGEGKHVGTRMGERAVWLGQGVGVGRASHTAHIGGAGTAREGGREEEGQRDASGRQLPRELGHTQLATCPAQEAARRPRRRR